MKSCQILFKHFIACCCNYFYNFDRFLIPDQFETICQNAQKIVNMNVYGNEVINIRVWGAQYKNYFILYVHFLYEVAMKSKTSNTLYFPSILLIKISNLLWFSSNTQQVFIVQNKRRHPRGRGDDEFLKIKFWQVVQPEICNSYLHLWNFLPPPKWLIWLVSFYLPPFFQFF